MIETSRRPDRVVLAPTAVAAIAATFVLMGLIVGAYGPLLEHLTHRFGVSLPVAGATISVHFAGSLPGVLIAMRSFRVLPARVTVVIATAVVSLGLVGVALAFAWSFFLVAVFVIGLGFIQGLATGAALAVLVVMAASVTLLPSVLGFAGRVIDKFALPNAKKASSATESSF